MEFSFGRRLFITFQYSCTEEGTKRFSLIIFAHITKVLIGFFWRPFPYYIHLRDFFNLSTSSQKPAIYFHELCPNPITRCCSETWEKYMAQQSLIFGLVGLMIADLHLQRCKSNFVGDLKFALCNLHERIPVTIQLFFILNISPPNHQPR